MKEWFLHVSATSLNEDWVWLGWICMKSCSRSWVNKTICDFDLAELTVHLSWQKPLTRTHVCNKLKQFQGFDRFQGNLSTPGGVLHGRSPSLGTHCDEGVVSTCFCNKLERRLSLAGVNLHEELFKILGEQNHLRFWLGWADCAPFLAEAPHSHTCLQQA